MPELSLQTEHRTNFISALRDELLAKINEDEVSYDRAFAVVALDYLGYASENLTDGKGDHGLDFAYLADSSAELFQFKAYDYTEDIDAPAKLGVGELTDLPRIRSLIEHLDTPPADANSEVRKVLTRLSAAVTRYAGKPQAQIDPFHVTINLVALSSSFTPQAKAEFEKLSKPLSIQRDKTQIQVSTVYVMLDDLLERRWQTNNTDWKDREGHACEKLDFAVVDKRLLWESESCVFYTNAFDLIQAYRLLGHQLFEPNVRCTIKRSKVNDEIKKSVQSSRGRKEFKHLNNGITMICESFQKVGPKTEPTALRVMHPGIINGLQTVTALEESYRGLPEGQQKEFREKCQILLRLHSRNAVHDYRELVKSTNNQNPMQARNLKSNDPEQIAYEQLFATVGWFYERKQGAWNAFKSDSSLWRTLPNVKKTHFQIGSTRKYRFVDNDELAQCWLAFIGFSNEAVHERKLIFEDDNVYNLVFLRRLPKHGADYDFKLSEDVYNAAAEDSPDHRLMLASFLLRHSAKNIVPSPKENRAEAVERLNASNLEKDEQDKKLDEDEKYRLNKILSAWSLLFPDFVGHILFRSFGEKAHTVGKAFIDTPSVGNLVERYDFDGLVTKIRDENFEGDDVLPVLWHLFEYCAGNLAAEDSPWLRQWRVTPTKTRFNYSARTRKDLFVELEHVDGRISRKGLNRSWADKMNDAKGVFKFVKKTLS
jgi:hypothetical protein